jgi:hypothetical protein
MCRFSESREMDVQGVKKFPAPLPFPHALLFMLIHICRTINNDSGSEAVIMNFLKYD